MAGMSSSSSSSHNRYLLLLSVVGALLVSARANDVHTIFIFGDSTVDVGTNDYITSWAKANFRYNGIDFPHSIPTGRFSNGYNNADQIGNNVIQSQSIAAYTTPRQDLPVAQTEKTI